MADVFLSYSSADRSKAVAVERALGGAGYDVFWDQETPAGVDWDIWIRDKLAKARVVVVLWSKSSIASPNVRHEAMIARDAGLLVPVLVEPLKPTDFPMGLYLTQALSLERWNGAADHPSLHRVVSEVAARMNRPAPSAPKPRKTAGAAPLFLGALALAATLGGGGYYWLSSQHAAVASNATTPVTPQTFAQSLAGRWRLLHAADCSAAFEIRATGDQFTLVGPDGTAQNETVTTFENNWLHTSGANDAHSFYKLDGSVLIYRYGDLDDVAHETEFQRCE